MKQSNGVVIYRGPSEIDGAPIVVIVTGINASSSNRKTGAMLQSYILADGVHPLEAIRTGADAAICGDCVHRGDGTGRGRTCYVNVGQGVASVYRALERGAYPDATETDWARMSGRPVRLGAYGDPAAAPLEVWSRLVNSASMHTGYTHQWRQIHPAWANIVMASVETELEREAAQALGYRTFRVALDDARSPGEVVCPASDEGGKKLTCAQCGACDGNARKRRGSIVIQIHGFNSGDKGREALKSRLIAAG